MTEKLRYRVTESTDGFEVREYEPFVSVEIESTGDWLAAGNRAFQPLLGFISGNNQAAKKYAMTAPVLQSAAAGGRHRVAFVLPVGPQESVPEATDTRLSVVRHDGGRYAAITFRGRWNETLFDEKTSLLKAKLASAGLQTAGEPITARNDPPWMPGFARTNEILIPLQ